MDKNKNPFKIFIRNDEMIFFAASASASASSREREMLLEFLPSNSCRESLVPPIHQPYQYIHVTKHFLPPWGVLERFQMSWWMDLIWWIGNRWCLVLEQRERKILVCVVVCGSSFQEAARVVIPKSCHASKVSVIRPSSSEQGKISNFQCRFSFSE